MSIEGGDDPGWEAVLGRTRSDPRHEWRYQLVADVLVHEIGGLPERLHVHLAVETETRECLSQDLAGRTVQGQGNWVDRTGDQLRSGSGRLDAGGKRIAAGALTVNGDGKSGLGPEPLDQLVCTVRRQRAGRVVQDDTRSADLGQLARLLDQKLVVATSARAVNEPTLELLARCEHGLGRLA